MNEIVFSKTLEEKLEGENLLKLSRELNIPKTLENYYSMNQP